MIRGAEGLTRAELLSELERGGRVVQFDYVVSVCVISMALTSQARLLRAGESAFAASLPYTLLSLLVGWWAIPFGPFMTLGVLYTNSVGGNDITAEITGRPAAPAPPAPRDPRIGWQQFKGESE